jgi:hypothetical protein
VSVWIWVCFLQDMSFLGVQGMCSEERLRERIVGTGVFEGIYWDDRRFEISRTKWDRTMPVFQACC